MASYLDPKAQTKILLRAVGIMLPAVLALMGTLTAVLGQDGDLFTVGILLAIVGLTWLGYGVSRLSAKTSEDEWPTGSF